MNLAPIALFVYNRPEHTRRTVEALAANDLAAASDLFIFSDGPKNEAAREPVSKVRAWLKTVTGFKSISIKERADNRGLAKSVIAGVSEIIREYGRAIVLEDDLISHPQLLQFLNEALNRYEDNTRIFSVTGFNYPRHLLRMPSGYRYSTYFSLRAHSWSWATWRDRWDLVDFAVSDYPDFSGSKSQQKLFNRGGGDLSGMLKAQVEGGIDSWAIRFCYSQYKHHGLTLYPVNSLVKNIGFDSSGVHCGTTDRYTEELAPAKFVFTYPSEIAVDPDIENRFRKIFRGGLSRQTFLDGIRRLKKILR